jgi:hemolysin activation/secretion protein
MKYFLKRATLIFFLGMLCNPCAVAWGQAQPNVQSLSGQQNPGLLTNPSLVPTEMRDQTKKQPRIPQDEIKLELPEHKPEAQKAPDINIPTTQIRVQGVTLIPIEEVQKLVTPYVGRNVTLTQLNGLAAAIADLYHQRGYFTADAYLPPQDIVDGVVTIQVQEGRAGKISIEGSRFYRAKLVRNALSQQPGELLNFKNLETELNRINRLNDGYKVKAFLSAGSQAGQTDLHVHMAERQPLQISGVADNQGRPLIGLYRGGVDLRSDSLTGNADQFYATWRANANMQLAMASYTIPLNRFGTQLSLSSAYSHVNIVLPIAHPPSITGNSMTNSLTLSQPLDRNRNLIVDSSLLWSEVGSYFEGDRTSFTDVRALQTGLSYNHYDRWGRTFNRIQSTVAIGGIGGTATFWKMENYFNRLIFLPRGNLLILRGNAQMTPCPLPSSQQFQIGGENSVRGFTEGLLIGDRGVNFGIEHRFPIPGLTKLNPWLGSRVQLALFYDYGRVWVDHSNPSYDKRVSNLTQRTLLQGVGVGLRVQLTRFMQGFVDCGFGLGDRKDVEPQNQPTARVHFGIRSDLLSSTYRERSSTPVVYIPRPAPKK